MKFEGFTTDGEPATNWEAIHRICARYYRFIIEVREFDLDREISLQQMKWLHCKNGPIVLFAEYMGFSVEESQRDLKREHGRQWLVEEVTEDNCNIVEGQVFYECQYSFCKRLIHPFLLIGRSKICPFCQSELLLLINIKSKKSISVKQTNGWIKNISAFMESINCRMELPDPKWQQNQQKEKELVKWTTTE